MGAVERHKEREKDADERMAREIAHYFEASQSGLEVVADGLEEMRFGEFLVASRAISRQQLLTALMFQDRNPGVRFGECIAALGFIPSRDVEILLDHWHSLNVVEVD